LFFSGFSLIGEGEIFSEYRIKNDVTVSAFSYGCIKLVENIVNGTFEEESSKKRIDTIQLFSPAFFNDKDEKFKRLQLMFFKKDSSTYCDNFLKNCGFNEVDKGKYFQMGTFEELQELLYYEWDEEKMERLKAKNIIIETYLGEDDRIINSQEALTFFRKFGEVYFIKRANHNLSLN
jgi:hypothetical protein